jgi:hypothetical protein
MTRRSELRICWPASGLRSCQKTDAETTHPLDYNLHGYTDDMKQVNKRRQAVKLTTHFPDSLLLKV